MFQACELVANVTLVVSQACSCSALLRRKQSQLGLEHPKQQKQKKLGNYRFPIISAECSLGAPGISAVTMHLYLYPLKSLRLAKLLKHVVAVAAGSKSCNSGQAGANWNSSSGDAVDAVGEAMRCSSLASLLDRPALCRSSM